MAMPKGWNNLSNGQKNKVIGIWADSWSDIAVEIEKNACPTISSNGEKYDYIKVFFTLNNKEMVTRLPSHPTRRR